RGTYSTQRFRRCEASRNRCAFFPGRAERVRGRGFAAVDDMRLRLAPERRVDVWIPGRPGTGGAGRFDAIREVHAELAAPARGRDMLHKLEIVCRHEPRTGMECVDCAHYLMLKPDADFRGATLRCLFLDDDPVHAVMT